MQHDATGLAIALIITLLVIGGVEQNPGPDFKEEHPPGPSFSGVSLMDIMEAIRVTQIQIDGLSSKIHNLESVIMDMSRNGNAQPAHPTTTSTALPTTSDQPLPTSSAYSLATAAEAPTKSSSPASPGTPDSRAWTTATSCQKQRGGTISKTPQVGAVMIGCQNVRRIAMAAREEFILGGQVVFRSFRGGTARRVLTALHGAVAGCRVLKADLILHVGGNDLAYRSVEYTLDCIAEIVNSAKQITKVRDIIICPVPQDPSMLSSFMSMKRSDLNDEIERLCKSEGVRFVDLRPRLNECAYHGLDKSRSNLNRIGSRNAWQMLASEVVSFLD